MCDFVQTELQTELQTEKFIQFYNAEYQAFFLLSIVICL